MKEARLGDGLWKLSGLNIASRRAPLQQEDFAQGGVGSFKGACTGWAPQATAVDKGCQLMFYTVRA